MKEWRINNIAIRGKSSDIVDNCLQKWPSKVLFSFYVLATPRVNVTLLDPFINHRHVCCPVWLYTACKDLLVDTYVNASDKMVMVKQ